MSIHPSHTRRISGSRVTAFGVAAAAAVTFGTVALVHASPAATAAAGDPVQLTDGVPAPPADLVGEPAEGEVSLAGTRSRTFSIHTNDKKPGGRFDGKVTWSGSGPYSGRVTGTVIDVEPDGYCVVGLVWHDGDMREISANACPVGKPTDHRSVNWSYKRTNEVLVAVCLKKNGYEYYCSNWS